MIKMTYDGEDITRYLFVEKVHRPLTPEIRGELIEASGKDGAYIEDSRHGASQILVDVRIIRKYTDDYEEYKRKLSGLLFKRRPAKLEFSNDWRYDYAVLRGQIDWEQFLYTGFAQLSFINPDGVSYGRDIKFNVNSGDKIGMFCTAEVKPVFKVTTTGTFFKIINNTKGDRITSGNMPHAVTDLIVDCEKEYIYKDDISYMTYLDLESDFFNIEDGDEIVLQGISDCELSYTERWY